MYQITLKHIGGRNYYHSYFKDETILGAVECDTLPPYQDSTMARSCYYDEGEWIFDEEMYDMLSEEENRKRSLQETYQELKTSNDELFDAVIELASIYESVIEPLTALAQLLAKGGD